MLESPTKKGLSAFEVKRRPHDNDASVYREALP